VQHSQGIVGDGSFAAHGRETFFIRRERYWICVTGDANFVLYITTVAVEDYQQFTRQFFHENPNIKSFETMVVVDRLKVGFAVAVGVTHAFTPRTFFTTHSHRVRTFAVVLYASCCQWSCDAPRSRVENGHPQQMLRA